MVRLKHTNSKSLISRGSFIVSLFLLCNAGNCQSIDTNSLSSTSTGIPLNTPWKKQVYAYAKKNVLHQSWGLAHAERDYQNSLELARQEKIEVDNDVLFAAACLHDLGGIGSFQKAKVDHGVRSAELAEPLLKSFGFPMEKWRKVKATIIGHVYYGPARTVPEAIVFHDADCLDFLGAIGVARIFAATNEFGSTPQLATSIQMLNEFIHEMPAKLITPTARTQADTRVLEMKNFLQELQQYSFKGKAL